MKLYSKGENYTLYNDNMLNLLEDIAPNSIESVVTDPPYEIGFMNKGWDKSGIAFQKETWEKCLTVLKPGGHLIAFGGAKTFHRIACAIEDAGFEIREVIMWIYGSSMPKSLNLGKSIESKLTTGGASPHNQRVTSMKDDYVPTGQTDYSKGALFKSKDDDYVQNDGNIELTHPESQKWEGWGTTLKPAYEPIIIARKPCEGSITDNVLTYGVGGFNIDGCRIPTDDYLYNHGNSFGTFNSTSLGTFGKSEKGENKSTELGRFPANIILSYDEKDEEEVCGGFPESEGCKPHKIYSSIDKYDGWGSITRKNGEMVGYDDNGGSAARYYYCAKASVKDKEEGLDELELSSDTVKGNGLNRVCEFCGAPILKPELCHCEVKSWVLPAKKNIHPTVKPTELMQYLVRLVTPENGTVLDPFNGSGSTGKACMWENRERNSNYKYIGIELTPEYLPIANARIDYVNKINVNTKEQLAEQVKNSAKVENRLLNLIKNKKQ
jgi:site-specific DNA-methyltransferase (adenine-specific)